MSCEKTEPLIYLYDDLSPEEKEVADTHITQCKACHALFQETQHMRFTWHTVATLKPKVKNSDRLTRNIMRAIKTGDRHKPAGVITSFLDSLFTRYAFGVSSLLLVLFFISEQQKDFNPEQGQSQVLNKTDVVLNTNSFLKASQEEQKGETWKLTSLYNCLKTNDCNETLIRNFKQRNTATHENI
jgi:hypothetical protein